MNPLRKLLFGLSLPLVLLVVVGTLRARVQEQTDQTLRDLKVFSETLGLVSKFYVEDVQVGQLQRGAYQGLAESLDPWSSYYDPDRMSRLLDRDRSAEAGLLLVKFPQKYVHVVAVIPGSPADRAGVKRLQFLETLDGLATKDLTLLEAQTMLSGPPGSVVKIGLPRETEEGEGRIVEVVLEDLAPLRVVTERPAPGVALLRVTDLRAGAAERVRRALSELTAAGIGQLILDLRTNVGGDAEEARAVADLFVGPGPLFQRRAREGAKVFAAQATPLWTGKLVTLVSGSTIGEAELLAAALDAADASPLVGMPTFGKFRQQELVKLSDGSGLFMSVAEYRHADGNPFDENGVQPDEKVARRDAGGDAEAAAPGEEDEDEVEAPEETTQAPAATSPPAAGPAVDRQLERALELLRGAQLKKAA